MLIIYREILLPDETCRFIVFDFDNMYAKRLRTYKRIGFRLAVDTAASKQDVNYIYDSGNYMDVFERDVIEAEKLNVH